MAADFRFQLQSSPPAHDGWRARAGLLSTPHGDVPTPAFMPVGTLGTVKGLTPQMVRTTGAAMVLGNTYHLSLRPGEETVAALGGLHQFMGWDGPILTDSGGFQVFSLSRLTKLNEEGVVFRSHIDGSSVSLTPERAIAIQEALGSDIAMVLDDVVRLPSEPERVQEACQRSVRWADRCLRAATRGDQCLFGIVQGGLDAELRTWCAAELSAMGFPGYAIGGLSVGESPEEMYSVLDVVCPALPWKKPRYLMGVGRPQDMLSAIRRGVDLFDCVMPTRNGRNAQAFTDDGPIRLRNRRYQTDSRPLDDSTLPEIRRFSRGYLRHLFLSGEMLGPILLSWHNIAYYQRLMRESRAAILSGDFAEFYREKMARWGAEAP